MKSLKNVKPWFRKQDGWWYVTRSVNGKRRQVKLVRGADQEEAAYRRFFEVMADAGFLEPSDEITFNELAARFLSWSQRENKPKTNESYVWFISKFDEFHQGRVTDLLKCHVDQWVDGKPWNRTTRRHAITCIKRVVNWGFEEGHLKTYPAGLRKLKRPKSGRRETLISDEDHQRMIDASDEAFANFLVALRGTGARPKEVRDITAEMVNLDVGVWIIHEHKTAEATATEKPRIIYLTPVVLKLSAELVAAHPSGPIFRNSKGTSWTSSAVGCRMKRLRKKLKLPAGTVAYAYRHTFCTRGLESGIAMADMAELLGHSDSRMLFEHYGHLGQKPQRLRELAELTRPTAGSKAQPEKATSKKCQVNGNAGSA